MERIKYRFIVYNKLWSNPKMNLYVTNPQFNNIHAVAHLHPGVHPWWLPFPQGLDLELLVGIITGTRLMGIDT